MRAFTLTLMGALIVSAASLTLAQEPKKDAEAAEKRAVLQIEQLTKAVQVAFTQNGKWPTILDEVAPLLEGGKKALGDPWGKQFQYAVVKDKPYIWTERKVGNETRVYGKKPPEEKKPDEKPGEKK